MAFYHGADTLSEASCIGLLLFNKASITGNVISICLIAVERFISVFFPLKSKSWITVSRVKKVSVSYSSWKFKSKFINKMLSPVRIELGFWSFFFINRL